MLERRSVPVWARTLDVLSLLLAAVTAMVAVSGGVRVAVTAAVPLLLCCAAIAIGRRIAVPQQPLYLAAYPFGIVFTRPHAVVRLAGGPDCADSPRGLDRGAPGVWRGAVLTWRPLF